ncbi:MAG: GDP-mannose 4,6-dehydratase [bacterium]|nr:GDP-mannose 4,6-dehydratase [bacterium]
MTKRTLVTGGAGFIGSWLCKVLADSGRQVIAFDDLSSGEESNLENLSDVSLIKGDIRKHADLSKIPWADISDCYHLAARGDVQESIENPLLYTSVNIVGTHNILESCRAWNIPILFMSTCMVYGLNSYQKIANDGINEEFPTLPISPYGASKLAGEQLALSYFYSYGLSVKIARPFNTYGPFQKANNLEGGVIPLFLNRKRQGNDLFVFGSGNQSRDFLYARDCAEFLISYMRTDNVPMILNAGSDKTITISELANTISAGDISIKYVDHPHPQSEIQRLLCDSSLARKTLGWEPRTSLKKGLEENLKWLNIQS